jgi:hypothetical protein
MEVGDTLILHFKTVSSCYYDPSDPENYSFFSVWRNSSGYELRGFFNDSLHTTALSNKNFRKLIEWEKGMRDMKSMCTTMDRVDMYFKKEKYQVERASCAYQHELQEFFERR